MKETAARVPLLNTYTLPGRHCSRAGHSGSFVSERNRRRPLRNLALRKRTFSRANEKSKNQQRWVAGIAGAFLRWRWCFSAQASRVWTAPSFLEASGRPSHGSTSGSTYLGRRDTMSPPHPIRVGFFFFFSFFPPNAEPFVPEKAYRTTLIHASPPFPPRSPFRHRHRRNQLVSNLAPSHIHTHISCSIACRFCFLPANKAKVQGMMQTEIKFKVLVEIIG